MLRPQRSRLSPRPGMDSGARLCRLGRRVAAVALAVALALSAGACTPDFDDIWLVKDLRILGIRADPPELLFRSVPTSVPPIELTVLAADPRDPHREVSWEVWACSAEADDCRSAKFSRRIAPPRRTKLDQIRYSFVPTREIFEKALANDFFKGFGGLPISVEFRLDDGDFVVSGFKRVVYTFPLPYSPVPADKKPNENPQLETIKVDGKKADPKKPLSVKRSPPPPPDGKGDGKLGSEVELLPVPAKGAKQSYVVVTMKNPFDPTQQSLGNNQLPDIETSTEKLEEYLTFFFFTTGGKISHAKTGGKPNPFVENKKIDDPSIEWTPPQKPGDHKLWIVINDGRGGVSWRVFDAKVE